MDYTMRQLTLFYTEALRHEAKKHAEDIVSVNLGMAGGKTADKAVRELTRRR